MKTFSQIRLSNIARFDYRIQPDSIIEYSQIRITPFSRFDYRITPIRDIRACLPLGFQHAKRRKPVCSP